MIKKLNFNLNQFRLILIFIFISVCIYSTMAADPPYQRMYPAPDANKAGVPPAPAAGDYSCWLATSANMLAGAGYGNGVKVQDRAEDIYNDMIAHYGIASGGWPDDAINWWLSSANNIWPNNPYDNVILYGSYSSVPYNNTNLPMNVGNKLRNGSLIGFGIRWPDNNGEVPGVGGHAITGWGDESTNYVSLATNNSQVIVTDSDQNIGEDMYNYNWQNYNNKFTHTNYPGWELSDYISSPFISSYWELQASPAGTIAHGSKTVVQTSSINASDLHFTAYQKENWVEILSYRTTINVPYTKVTVTESDHGMGDGKIHAITVDYDGLDVSNGTSVTIDVEFILSSWNTVRFEGVYFSYPTVGFPAKISPDTGWVIRGIQKDKITDQKPVPTPPIYYDPKRNLFNGLGAVVPERGYIVASYETRNMAGDMSSVDMALHQFDESVLFNQHFLEIYNDDRENILVSNIKMGYSEGYLTDEQLRKFDNWTMKNDDTYQLQRGSSIEFEYHVYSMPVITQIKPAEGYPGKYMRVTILGANFTPETDFNFSGDDIKVYSKRIVNDQQVLLYILINNNARPGTRNVYAINPGRNPAVLHEGFKVLK